MDFIPFSTQIHQINFSPILRMVEITYHGVVSKHYKFMICNFHRAPSPQQHVLANSLSRFPL